MGLIFRNLKGIKYLVFFLILNGCGQHNPASEEGTEKKAKSGFDLGSYHYQSPIIPPFSANISVSLNREFTNIAVQPGMSVRIAAGSFFSSSCSIVANDVTLPVHRVPYSYEFESYISSVTTDQAIHVSCMIGTQTVTKDAYIKVGKSAVDLIFNGVTSGKANLSWTSSSNEIHGCILYQKETAIGNVSREGHQAVEIIPTAGTNFSPTEFRIKCADRYEIPVASNARPLYVSTETISLTWKEYNGAAVFPETSLNLEWRGSSQAHACKLYLYDSIGMEVTPTGEISINLASRLPRLPSPRITCLDNNDAPIGAFLKSPKVKSHESVRLTFTLLDSTKATVLRGTAVQISWNSTPNVISCSGTKTNATYPIYDEVSILNSATSGTLIYPTALPVNGFYLVSVNCFDNYGMSLESNPVYLLVAGNLNHGK